MSSKHRARGKALELHVGRMFGGRRRRSGEGLEFDDCVALDGSALPISFECKSHERLQLRSEWVAQAERNSHGRPWVIAQRPTGSRRIYATCDLAFLQSLAVRAGLLPGEENDGRVAGAG